MEPSSAKSFGSLDSTTIPSTLLQSVKSLESLNAVTEGQKVIFNERRYTFQPLKKNLNLYPSAPQAIHDNETYSPKAIIDGLHKIHEKISKDISEVETLATSKARFSDIKRLDRISRNFFLIKRELKQALANDGKSIRLLTHNFSKERTVEESVEAIIKNFTATYQRVKMINKQLFDLTKSLDAEICYVTPSLQASLMSSPQDPLDAPLKNFAENCALVNLEKMFAEIDLSSDVEKKNKTKDQTDPMANDELFAHFGISPPNSPEENLEDVEVPTSISTPHPLDAPSKSFAENYALLHLEKMLSEIDLSSDSENKNQIEDQTDPMENEDLFAHFGISPPNSPRENLEDVSDFENDRSLPPLPAAIPQVPTSIRIPQVKSRILSTKIHTHLEDLVIALHTHPEGSWIIGQDKKNQTICVIKISETAIISVPMSGRHAVSLETIIKKHHLDLNKKISQTSR